MRNRIVGKTGSGRNDTLLFRTSLRITQNGMWQSVQGIGYVGGFLTLSGPADADRFRSRGYGDDQNVIAGLQSPINSREQRATEGGKSE